MPFTWVNSCGDSVATPDDCFFVVTKVIDARLQEADTELTAARRLLREAGAERELLRHRVEEARQETEDLLRGGFQARVYNVCVRWSFEIVPVRFCSLPSKLANDERFARDASLRAHAADVDGVL